MSVIMTEETLRALIAGGETGTVEFKSSGTRPIEVAVRMCGMANNRAGGIIIFGIEDATRAIVGIRNPSSTHDVVLRAARMVKPAVPLGETSVQIWTIDGCTLLTVEIPPNSGRLLVHDTHLFDLVSSAFSCGTT
jgi:ATP-dependent DNA helicase RecG